MKNHVLFVAVALFWSCHNQSNRMDLFAGLNFRMEKGEHQAPIDENLHADFKTFVPNSNVPLYRVIESDDYRIFIGLPFRTSLEELTGGDSAVFSIVQSDSDTVFYKKYTTESTVVVKFAKRYKDNLVYLVATTTSPLIADSLFDRTAWANRISE